MSEWTPEVDDLVTVAMRDDSRVQGRVVATSNRLVWVRVAGVARALVFDRRTRERTGRPYGQRKDRVEP